MPEFTTPLTTDSDITTWEARLTGNVVVIGKVNHLHERASDEVARALRDRWWSDRVRDGYYGNYDASGNNGIVTYPVLSDFDANKLSAVQLKRVATFLLLSFVWDMLDTHNEENTFPKKRAQFWVGQYSEEMDKLLNDGILYDWAGTGTPTNSDKSPGRARGSIRLERE